jgi:hypothetical protein
MSLFNPAIFDGLSPITIINLNRYILPYTTSKIDDQLAIVFENIDCAYVELWITNKQIFSKVKKAINI